MRRTPRRFLTSLARLVGPPIMMFAPMVAAHAHSDIAVPASATTAADSTGMTITVTNCNDRGPGSLRAAVASAASGDTIDLTSLACSRIILTNRGIQVPQNDLNVVGRHRDALTIDGNRSGRVFRHTGAGTLRLRRVSIANGYVVGANPLGGCIHSLGGVELIGAQLHHCELRAEGGLKPSGAGGGIFAKRVLLSYSSAYSNISDGRVEGGGGALWVSDNVAWNGGAAVLPSNGETRIFNSTIAFNQDQPTGPFAECLGAIEAFQLCAWRAPSSPATPAA